MRHANTASRNLMDYLFIEIMLWGKQAGYRWFNLGMAPLSGMQDREFAPVWNRMAAFLYRHGEHFYNFNGLRRYKEQVRSRVASALSRLPGRARVAARADGSHDVDRRRHAPRLHALKERAG